MCLDSFDSTIDCVPNGEIWHEVLSEIHSSSYSIHPSGKKCVKTWSTAFSGIGWSGRLLDLYPSIWYLASEGWTLESTRVTSTIIHTKVKVEKVTIDFITELLRSRRDNNATWVIVDRLINVAHSIPFCEGCRR